MNLPSFEKASRSIYISDYSKRLVSKFNPLLVLGIACRFYGWNVFIALQFDIYVNSSAFILEENYRKPKSYIADIKLRTCFSAMRISLRRIRNLIRSFYYVRRNKFLDTLRILNAYRSHYISNIYIINM